MHSYAQLPLYVSLPQVSLSYSQWSLIYTPSKHHVSSTCLASACVPVSTDVTLPISPSLRYQQETEAHCQRFFDVFLSMESL